MSRKAWRWTVASLSANSGQVVYNLCEKRFTNSLAFFDRRV